MTIEEMVREIYDRGALKYQAYEVAIPKARGASRKFVVEIVVKIFWGIGRGDKIFAPKSQKFQLHGRV